MPKRKAPTTRAAPRARRQRRSLSLAPEPSPPARSTRTTRARAALSTIPELSEEQEPEQGGLLPSDDEADTPQDSDIDVPVPAAIQDDESDHSSSEDELGLPRPRRGLDRLDFLVIEPLDLDTEDEDNGHQDDEDEDEDVVIDDPMDIDSPSQPNSPIRPGGFRSGEFPSDRRLSEVLAYAENRPYVPSAPTPRRRRSSSILGDSSTDVPPAPAFPLLLRAVRPPPDGQDDGIYDDDVQDDVWPLPTTPGSRAPRSSLNLSSPSTADDRVHDRPVRDDGDDNAALVIDVGDAPLVSVDDGDDEPTLIDDEVEDPVLKDDGDEDLTLVNDEDDILLPVPDPLDDGPLGDTAVDDPEIGDGRMDDSVIDDLINDAAIDDVETDNDAVIENDAIIDDSEIDNGGGVAPSPADRERGDRGGRRGRRGGRGGRGGRQAAPPDNPDDSGSNNSGSSNGGAGPTPSDDSGSNTSSSPGSSHPGSDRSGSSNSSVDIPPPPRRGFRIARVIHCMDKAHGVIEPPNWVNILDPDDAESGDPTFRVEMGDYVLVLSQPGALKVTVRNYEGQQGKLPRRMLQDIWHPWQIPPNIRMVPDGVPLPLHFVRRARTKVQGDGREFDANEPVMVMNLSDNPAMSEVLDFERFAGTIRNNDLNNTYPVPWLLLVEEDELEELYDGWSVKVPKRSRRVLGAAGFTAKGAREKTTRDFLRQSAEDRNRAAVEAGVVDPLLNIERRRAASRRSVDEAMNFRTPSPLPVSPGRKLVLARPAPARPRRSL